jgi:hypothetical protein
MIYMTLLNIYFIRDSSDYSSMMRSGIIVNQCVIFIWMTMLKQQGNLFWRISLWNFRPFILPSMIIRTTCTLWWLVNRSLSHDHLCIQTVSHQFRLGHANVQYDTCGVSLVVADLSNFIHNKIYFNTGYSSYIHQDVYMETSSIGDPHKGQMDNRWKTMPAAKPVSKKVPVLRAKNYPNILDKIFYC